MTENISAAVRHIGVALIDLEYAILELSQCSCARSMQAQSMAMDDLIEERNRLRKLNAQLTAAFNESRSAAAGWTRKHWPDLARTVRPDFEAGWLSPEDPSA